jgi:hypothetical protein
MVAVPSSTPGTRWLCRSTIGSGWSGELVILRV